MSPFCNNLPSINNVRPPYGFSNTVVVSIAVVAPQVIEQLNDAVAVLQPYTHNSSNEVVPAIAVCIVVGTALPVDAIDIFFPLVLPPKSNFEIVAILFYFLN